MAKISYESIGKDRENNIDGFDPTLAPFALSHPKAFKAHAERNLGYWSGLAEDILNHKHSYFVHIYPCLRVIETGIQLGSREAWHMAKYLLFLSTSLDEERDEVVHKFLYVLNHVQIMITYIKNFMQNPEVYEMGGYLCKKGHDYINEEIQSVEDKLAENYEHKDVIVDHFLNMLTWEINQKFTENSRNWLQNMLKLKAITSIDNLSKAFKDDLSELEKVIAKNVTPTASDLENLCSDLYCKDHPCGSKYRDYIWQCLNNWNNLCLGSNEKIFWCMVKNKIDEIKTSCFTLFEPLVWIRFGTQYYRSM